MLHLLYGSSRQLCSLRLHRYCRMCCFGMLAWMGDPMSSRIMAWSRQCSVESPLAHWMERVAVVVFGALLFRSLVPSLEHKERTQCHHAVVALPESLRNVGSGTVAAAWCVCAGISHVGVAPLARSSIVGHSPILSCPCGCCTSLCPHW